jgi:hypothetical protein
MMTENVTPAFIIGNGRSRQGFDLNLLKGNGAVFGCNALYRDLDHDLIDHLVVIDMAITKELQESDFPQDKLIVPEIEDQWEPVEYTKIVGGNRKRGNTGMVCMLEAIKRGHTELYCMGFDFLINDTQESVTNMYDGSDCYGPETRSTFGDNQNRVKFLEWFAMKNGLVKFNFLFPDKATGMVDRGTKALTFHVVSALNVKGLFYSQLEFD